MLSKQAFYCSNSIRNPGCHCRSSALECDVLPAEVVPREVQAIAVRMLTHLLENAFVRRVSLRMHIRIVKFCRSTCDGQILEASGSP
jgi:hypothetical protein